MKGRDGNVTYITTCEARWGKGVEIIVSFLKSEGKKAKNKAGFGLAGDDMSLRMRS